MEPTRADQPCRRFGLGDGLILLAALALTLLVLKGCTRRSLEPRQGRYRRARGASPEAGLQFFGPPRPPAPPGAGRAAEDDAGRGERLVTAHSLGAGAPSSTITPLRGFSYTLSGRTSRVSFAFAARMAPGEGGPVAGPTARDAPRAGSATPAGGAIGPHPPGRVPGPRRGPSPRSQSAAPGGAPGVSRNPTR